MTATPVQTVDLPILKSTLVQGLQQEVFEMVNSIMQEQCPELSVVDYQEARDAVLATVVQHLVITWR